MLQWLLHLFYQLFPEKKSGSAALPVPTRLITMSNFPAYDEVHVISDIHMGGAEPDFQVLKETQRLAGYIQWVGQQNPAGQVALVLNGDVFDTLAEKSPDYIMVERAVEVVSNIMANPSFRGIWAALAAFVALAGDDPLKRARIEFSTIGAGFSCTVGGSTIYCTHGNEVDAWNFNRYEDLAKVGRRLNAGRALTQQEWTPNAGTRMVKEVMNQVKEKYKWIDLLKPETQAAVGTLVVLDPSQAKKIADLLSIVGRKTMDSALQVNQRLSMDGFQTHQEQGVAAPALTQVLGSHLTQGIRQYASAGGQSVDAMLLQAEQNLGTPNAQLYQQDDGQLGTGCAIFQKKKLYAAQ
jgi:hypothetical protein